VSVVLALVALALVAASRELRPAAAAAPWPFDGVAVGTVSTLRGDLDALVGDLSALMAQRDSRLYRDPTDEEAKRLRSGVASANRGQLSSAARELADVPRDVPNGVRL
jgi:hypothetical protein